MLNVRLKVILAFMKNCLAVYGSIGRKKKIIQKIKHQEKLDWLARCATTVRAPAVFYQTADDNLLCS